MSFALVDYAMGDVIMRALPADQLAVTLNIAINFVGSVDSGLVTCLATLDRAGRSVASASATVRSESGTLMATAVGTFAVRPRPATSLG